MYTPKAFACEDREALHKLMDAYPFAILLTPDGAITHVPLLLLPTEGEQGTLFGHIARPNPQVESLRTLGRATAVFSGPHGYISPRWYETALAVPTWNYAAVHAHGPVRIIEGEDFLARLGQLLDRYEPAGWQTRMPAEFLRKQLPGIVGFELAIEHIEGKRKLSQNKSQADIQGAIAGLEAEGNTELVALMREASAS
ncbi:MAG: FMN-binding negative transcriptional regulator [Armatimonas sp.]